MHSRPCCTTLRSATTRPRANDSAKERDLGQRFAFNANRPEVHDLIRRWRRLADGYNQPRLLFGETWVPTVERLADYYGNGHDELHLAWNLPFLGARFRAGDLSQVIGHTIQTLPSDAIPAWAISTHDGEGRAATRWCSGDDNAIRCALFVLLGLPGTSILYYGDEIGMTARPLDRVELDQRYPAEERFVSRTPMQWDRGAHGGFSNGQPWLPVGDTERANVADQIKDPASVLHLCRDLIRVRTKLPPERMSMLASPTGMLAWRCDDATIAINLGDRKTEVTASGSIAVCTNRERQGERTTGTLMLSPMEAAIVL